MPARRIDVAKGQRFGRWTVLRETYPNERRRERRFVTRCVCGREGVVELSNLRKGHSRGCTSKACQNRAKREAA